MLPHIMANKLQVTSLELTDDILHYDTFKNATFSVNQVGRINVINSVRIHATLKQNNWALG